MGVERGDLDPHLEAKLGVEVGERLVEEEYRRLADDRAADGDALALAARELAGAAFEQAVDLQELGGVLRRRRAISSRGTRRFSRPKDRFLRDRHMGVERVGLEHHREAAFGGGDVVDALAFQQDVARGRVVETGDQAQQGGFAAARGADEDHELAFRDRERDAVDHVDRAEATCGCRGVRGPVGSSGLRSVTAAARRTAADRGRPPVRRPPGRAVGRCLGADRCRVGRGSLSPKGEGQAGCAPARRFISAPWWRCRW